MKIISEQEIGNIIKDEFSVAFSGFGTYGCPDQVIKGISGSYRQSGHPRDLTAVMGISAGKGNAEDIGINRLADPGLLKTIIASHIADAPVVENKITANEIAGYFIPLGVTARLLKAIACGEKGILTHVGLYTMADPLLEGCCANEKARQQKRNLVERMEIGEDTQLYYHTFPLDAVCIRATWADEDGNLSCEQEPITGLEFEMAQAAHNSGGIVIAQVKGIVPKGSIHPKKVRIPHTIVDYVLVADPEYHFQGFAEEYAPQLCGEAKVQTDAVPSLPLDIKKVIARRGVFELKPGTVINLGKGIPSNVGPVANEENIEGITMSLESGPLGGVPLSGLKFAASVNPEFIGALSETFDFYDGGGLAVSCLGAAQIDKEGNVNVSQFSGRSTGPGGFINISQNTKNICFMCTFTAGKSDIRVENGAISINSDGDKIKFINNVSQVTFSARYARMTGQNILYITERAVFRLAEEGIELIEIAPGVDLEKDILAKMEFTPQISENLKLMDPRLFKEGAMGIN